MLPGMSKSDVVGMRKEPNEAIHSDLFGSICMDPSRPTGPATRDMSSTSNEVGSQTAGCNISWTDAAQLLPLQ